MEKVYGLILNGNILFDRWGDLIASQNIQSIMEWCGYADFMANGAEIKEIRNMVF